MAHIIEFLIRHGYLVLFGAVCVEQMGFPIPAAPFLLGMGMLTGEGHFVFGVALLIAGLGSLPGDFTWYELGRRRGYGVLRVICRLSIEAETCVRRTENLFLRYGGWALVLAKFIPGFSTVAPPLAGLLRMKRSRFLALDYAGALLWAGAFLLTGRIFRRQIAVIVEWLERLGSWAFVVLAGGLTLYILWKLRERRRYLRALAVERVQPEELAERLARSEPVTIVDLRHTLEYDSVGQAIAGALHIEAAEMRSRMAELPRDRDIVLYCT